jgi:hypothetical protein
MLCYKYNSGAQRSHSFHGGHTISRAALQQKLLSLENNIFIAFEKLFAEQIPTIHCHCALQLHPGWHFLHSSSIVNMIQELYRNQPHLLLLS